LNYIFYDLALLKKDEALRVLKTEFVRARVVLLDERREDFRSELRSLRWMFNILIG
jgi:hypothetical protein